MFIMVSLEKRNYFSIVNANNEIKFHLGYKKEELISFSATKLMPDIIAQRHDHYMNKFFKTMEGKYIGIESIKFINHREGYIVPCVSTIHIFPSILNGLQAVMILYEDPTISLYTEMKTDKTQYKVIHKLL